MAPRVFGLCVVLALAAGVSACIPVDVNTSPATNSALTTATANVKDGLTTLGKGLDQLGSIDPLGINKLLTENAALRDQFQKVAATMNAAAGLGVIEISNRAVRIQVETYTGAFRVDGWVDQDTNKFWFGRTFSRKDFSFGNPEDNIRPILNVSDQHFRGPNYPAIDQSMAWDNMARAAQIYLLDKVLAFNRTNTIVPGSADDEIIDLNTRLGSLSGPHTVILRVTPIATDSSGQWSIRFHLFLKTEGNTDEGTGTYDLTKDMYANSPLNTPLPDLKIYMNVKVAT